MSNGPERPPLTEEQLSAWLDDELPPAELELLAARLASSPDLQARVARYGLIGSALRGGQSRGVGGDLVAMQLSGRVRRALDAEVPAPSARLAANRSRLAPYAAAAGVALLALTLVPLVGPVTRDGTATPRVAGVAAGKAAPALMVERVAAPAQASLSPRRLTSYLVYHGEYAGMLSAKLTDSHIVNNRAYAVTVHAPDETARR
jgi:negative regulator of sigma E activity